MANPSERGGQQPSQTTHPRMSNPPASSQTSSQQSSGSTGTLAGMAGQAQEALRSAATQVSGQLSQAGDAISRGVHDSGEWVERTAGEALDTVTSYIRRNPVMSVAAAFGAGILVTCCISAWTSSGSDMTRRMSGYSS